MLGNLITIPRDGADALKELTMTHGKGDDCSAPLTLRGDPPCIWQKEKEELLYTQGCVYGNIC